MAQLLGALSYIPKVCGFNSWQGTYLGFGFDPDQGMCKGNRLMLLSHMDVSLSPPFPLSKMIWCLLHNSLYLGQLSASFQGLSPPSPTQIHVYIHTYTQSHPFTLVQAGNPVSPNSHIIPHPHSVPASSCPGFAPGT